MITSSHCALHVKRPWELYLQSTRHGVSVAICVSACVYLFCQKHDEALFNLFLIA